MSKKFDSVIASPMADFVRSPLGVRETGGVGRAVYIIALSSSIRDARFFVDGETLFRLSLDDLTVKTAESRPPWWPAPDPLLGQLWGGATISGDSNVLWYSAANRQDLANDIYTTDIFKLNSRFEVIQSSRWHQPPLGDGTAWRIMPFGDSSTLFGLVFVNPVQEVTAFFEEMYIVELDPRTMEILRTSADLFEGLTPQERTSQRYNAAGGGASAIWLTRRIIVGFESVDQILEFNPSDFSLVRTTRALRGALPFPDRRDIHGIGGDPQSIWIAVNSGSFGSTGSVHRVSELPRDFSDDNRDVIQDEVIAPEEDIGESRHTAGIG